MIEVILQIAQLFAFALLLGLALVSILAIVSYVGDRLYGWFQNKKEKRATDKESTKQVLERMTELEDRLDKLIRLTIDIPDYKNINIDIVSPASTNFGGIHNPCLINNITATTKDGKYVHLTKEKLYEYVTIQQLLGNHEYDWLEDSYYKENL